MKSYPKYQFRLSDFHQGVTGGELARAFEARIVAKNLGNPGMDEFSRLDVLVDALASVIREKLKKRAEVLGKDYGDVVQSFISGFKNSDAIVLRHVLYMNNMKLGVMVLDGQPPDMRVTGMAAALISAMYVRHLANYCRLKPEDCLDEHLHVRWDWSFYYRLADHAHFELFTIGRNLAT